MARERTVTVRLSEQEYATWTHEATRSGRTLANWIRWRCDMGGQDLTGHVQERSLTPAVVERVPEGAQAKSQTQARSQSVTVGVSEQRDGGAMVPEILRPEDLSPGLREFKGPDLKPSEKKR